MRSRQLLFLTIFVLTILNVCPAQEMKGNSDYRRVGVHDGNAVKTSFTNYGVIGQPGSFGANCAWPNYSNGYATDIQPLVGLQLPLQDYKVKGVYDGKADTLYSVIGCDGDRSGERDLDQTETRFWGFEPLPGYINETLDALDIGVAMSHRPETWPNFWPDHPDWIDDDGKPEWFGYFGRGKFNADQESFFKMDDNTDEKMYEYYRFLPDSTDLTRKGQGIQTGVRGMQWSNPMASDVIFWLYDIKNIGTSNYRQAVFGTLVGTYIGVGPTFGNEWADDASLFDVRESLVYSWDFDNFIDPSSNARWDPFPTSVGYIGYAFLESPGNQYDGIDNDNDSKGMAPRFTEDDFRARVIHPGDNLVLVDGNTYERSIITMPDTTITVVSMGFEYTLIPNETMLAEGNMYGNSLNDNAYDGLDNDLDGLIDENYQIHYRQYLESTEGIVLLDLTNPVCYKDYVTGYGLDDPMIDESRQDLIDNDNDWDPERDDVGADGKADTYDYGEGDGVPTTGEPHFDRTDVDESDQIGLTSFDYFVPSTDIDRGNENEMWGRLFPGRFEVPESVIGNRPARGEDGDFIFGSGYFPLFPGDVQSFSMALVFGSDLEALKRSKGIAQMIYDSNYNFPRPPERPTLTAVAGDGRVTLYWDRIAEDSYDESLQEYDFEGYKIYKGTDPAFSDAKTISNGFGDMVDYDPEEQFDLENQITGFFNADPILSDKVGGRPYYLGDDSGIQNYFVDENVINGKTYYYAVCAYDHGNEKESVFPSENSKSIYVDAAGKPYPEQNCAVVVPNPPVSGYLPPQSDMLMNHDAGFSTHIPFVEVVDPARVKDVTYRITFVDSMVEDVQLARGYTLINMTDNDTLCKNNSNILPWNGDVFDGLRFSFNTKYQDLANVKLDTLRSGWNNTNGDNLEIIASSKFNYKDFEITRCPYDYLFVFSDSIVTKSSILSSIFGVPSPFKEIDTNFKIYNVTDPDHPVEAQYGFVDALTGEKNRLSHFDGVYLSNPDGTVLSWKIVLSGQEAPVPAAGDSLLLSFYKPFNSNDEFSYMSKASQSDLNLSKNEMDEIRVVPNPYVITNLFEKPLPSQMTGRGERIVNFINLPNKCTIKIFSSSGSHIRTLEHEGGLENGTCSWNLRSKEGLDVAFGVYFYVVEAGEFNDKKMGKLAIIK